MELTTYLNRLLLNYNDIRVKKNILELSKSVIVNGHLRLFSLFSEKKYYERMKGLLGGESAHTLDSETLLHCVQQRSIEALGDCKRVYVLHDPSDIRKPSSQDMEHIGKVLGLNKAVINGYRSVNCVAIDPDNQGVNLLFHELYSQEHPNYISQEALEHPETLPADKAAIYAKKQHINGMILCQQQLKGSHDLLKKQHKTRVITHILDREFDSEDLFSYINDLGDEFVIRAKLSRIASQGEEKSTPTGKISKRLYYPKLVVKKFANQSSYSIDTITIKNKTYRQVTAVLEWDSIVLDGKSYSVVRITLKQGNKPLFEHPMLLITNRLIQTGEAAKNVYQAYVLRFKIEVVFKFLKQNLGWETFQIRDFNSIKNLLALAFFLVGYFKELEEELQKHELAQFLCKIAYSKGKITPFFLLKGLEKIAHFNEIKQWMEAENISHEQIQALLDEFLS